MKYVVRCVAFVGVITLAASALLTFALADDELTGSDVLQIEVKNGSPPPETIRSQLPHCGPNTKSPAITRRPLVLVSTMDGEMMALDAENGNPIWKLFESEENTMLSASMSNMDIFPQIIPSLDGTLYKYDGNKFEALPVNAESLLSSSFKYTPDMVMSGGKEVITYGVIPGSGKVQYKCGMSGCSPSGELGVVDDMLIVERLTQTVRAVDPRTGTERWNFSVGQHNIKLLEKDHLPGCQGGSDNEPKEPSVLSDVQLRMTVGKGQLQALSDLQVIWEKELNSPIVHVWRLEGNVLQPVDIFDIRDETVTSMVYVGEHNNQLYIQQKTQGVKGLEELEEAVYSQGAVSVEVKKFPVVDWKPYQHTSASRTPLIYYPQPRDNVPQIEDKKKKTALQEYDTSQYPYDDPSEAELSEDKRSNFSGSEDWRDFDNIMDPDGELTLSLQLLSFWWKEILLMVVTLAIVLNLITQPVIDRIRHNRIKMQFKRVVEVLIGRIYMQQQQGVPMLEAPPSSPPPVTEFKVVEVKERHPSAEPANATPFVSRFLTDFEPVSSLGRGGFGVVFHAKNKLDDRGYAVKRIQLPSKEAARVKMMREVKTLAKLEHKNIVRYFSAWVETPPPGWIQQHDPDWMAQSESQLDVDSSFSSRLLQRPSLLPLTSCCDNTPSFNRFSPMPSYTDIPKKEESEDSGGVVFQHEDSGGVVFQHEDSGQEPTPRNCAKDYHAVTIDSPSQSSSINDSDDEKRPCDRKKKRKARTRTLVQESVDNSSSSGPLIAYQWKDSSRVELSSVFDTSESSGLGQTIETSQSFIVFDNTKTQKGRNIDNYKTKIEYSQVSNSTGVAPRMYLYIQMELCERESLADWLWAHTTNRDHNELLSMFNQILSAVECVHREGLIHRDLKPSNVMFSGQKHTIKVGDFGLVTAMSSDSGEILTPVGSVAEVHTDQVGTRLYMSPELESGQAYNYKVDIFSLGMMFYELLVPFSTQMERNKALSDVKKRRFPDWFTTKYPNEHELLRQMLSPNPDERPTTIGVRALPPMLELQEASVHEYPSSEHYQLPQRKRNNTVSSQSSSN